MTLAPIPFRAALLALAAALGVGGCGSLPSSTDSFLGLITPYRIDIVQGNVVTKEQLALVKPGMSRAQVRDVLGSPLLVDPFHADRWDYIFTIRRQGTAPQRRSVVAHFKGDLLEKIDSPELPTENEFVAAISTTQARGPEPVLSLTDAQRKALPLPTKRDPAAVPPSGPERTYPPLEAQ